MREIGDDDLDQFAALTQLYQLSLNGTGVTDNGLRRLEGQGRLLVLHLEGCDITDGAAESLSRLPGLDQLNLSATQVTPEGIAAIARARPGITIWFLERTGLDDGALAALRQLPRVGTIFIEHTNVTAAAVEAFRSAHPKCHIYSDFGVFRPRSGSDAATRFALQFDGDDYAALPIRYDGSHPLTYELWCEAAGLDVPEDGQQMVTKLGAFDLKLFGGGSTGDEWQALLWDDQARQWIDSQWQTVVKGPTHLALQWDGSQLSLFVNGRAAVESVSSAPTPPIERASALFREFAQDQAVVGSLWPFRADQLSAENIDVAPFYFVGKINEIRVSRSIRYSQPFTPEARFESDEHTLALYHFDEGQGDILTDSSGNGHHGKIVGATWVTAGTLPSPPAGHEPYDPAADRAIAEDVLRAGGNVTIVVPQAPPDGGQLQSYRYGTNLLHQLPLLGQEQTARSLEELPVEPFHVTRIQLRQQAAIDSSLVESLAGLPFLFELNLEHSAVNDGHAAVIGRMPQLRYLNVGATSLADAGMQELSRLADLRYLAAHQLPGITDAGLEHVARLNNLVEIYLHGNPQITDRGIASLRDLPHVGWLWLEGTGITDAALESVSGFLELDSLRLSNTKINGSGLTHLARLQKLNWLFLHDTEITDEFGVLLKDVQFGSLWLSGTSVGDATLKAIAGRQDIHQLILNGTRITDTGLAHLKGTRIVHLSANNTALTGSGLGGLNIVAVLDLSGTQLSDEAAESIARFETLKVLNVAQTPVSEGSVKLLAGALPNCTIYSNFGTIEPRLTPASVGTVPR